MAPPCAVAEGAAGRIAHLDGLAQPAGCTAVGCMPTSTAHSEEITPPAITQHALAHGRFSQQG